MKFSYELGPQEKHDYLALIYEGYKPNLAASECDSTGTQFRKLRSPNSEYYDPEFAAGYEAAIRSEEHAENFEDRVRDLVWRRAEHSDRLVEKLAMIHLPEWEPLRHANLNINVRMQTLQMALPYMTKDEIERLAERMDAEVEQPELKLLPKPAA